MAERSICAAQPPTEVLVSVWRQRLWFEPHRHAAALLLRVPAHDAAFTPNAM